MFTLKVGQAETYQDIEQRETRLRVPFSIVDEAGTVATERIESFPITATRAEVDETLKRHLEVYTADHERYEAGKAHQEALDQSQALAGEISNTIIQ
jgi:hypothetical protein